MSNEPESLDEQALEEDDYWFKRQYVDLFYFAHGHFPAEPCETHCPGKQVVITRHKDATQGFVDMFREYEDGVPIREGKGNYEKNTS